MRIAVADRQVTTDDGNADRTLIQDRGERFRVSRACGNAITPAASIPSFTPRNHLLPLPQQARIPPQSGLPSLSKARGYTIISVWRQKNDIALAAAIEASRQARQPTQPKIHALGANPWK